MIEIDLLAGQSVVDLGAGISLHPRGLVGKVRVESAAPVGTRALAGAPMLLPQLAGQGLRLGPVVTLPPEAGDMATRGLAEGRPSMVAAPSLEVEVGPDESCVLLVEDAHGALTWVLPDESPQAALPPSSEGAEARGTATSTRGSRSVAEAGGARSLPGSLHFTLPPPASAGTAGTRGLFGDLTSKVQAVFFDATDALLGPIIHGFARKWEAKHRPSFCRRLGPDDYSIDDPAFPRLTLDEWQALAKGPALLFVHGTFSTSAAFGGLPRAVISDLSRSYRGRVFAFNHPSLTADPRENALAFLSDVPKEVKLELDIVCHSRGGLVSRQIEALGRTAGNVRVRRIVFVGATNAGTALADDDHMVEMISRFTTIAKFIPEGTARTTLDALVLVVKVLGHGLLHDLEGLAAMNPRGTFMKAMNAPGESAAQFYAIAADFEPKPGTPLFSLRRAEDAAADRVFGNDANDLVVPRDGVFARNGAGGFPIDTVRCLQYGTADGVIHTEFFSEPRTGKQIVEWLQGDAPAAARDLAPTGPTPAQIARIFDAARDRLLFELTAQPVGRRGFGSRDDDFTPGELDQLRPHVINLHEGSFKASGIYASTPEDVDAIVHEHIPRWAITLPAGDPLRVVVWAHGGLIDEKAGLRIAQKHVEWWKRNGVYPIYFVWETGLFDALRAILEKVRSRIPGFGGRDLFDFTSDPLIELGARALGGGHIWGAMKRNAELASAAEGGARRAAQQLAVLAGTPALQHGHALELHAVGHSAGAIFHSWFLPMARAERVPAFKTLQLLAPAITVAEFDARLVREIGGGGAVERALLYTMKRHYEEADNCAGVYRKSLLYLIHHALEAQKREPVLGLEISLRADDAAARLFGLKSAASAPGRVIWSVTDETIGRSASTSVHHGDFDDDIPTMGSVAANVLDALEPRVPYPGSPPNARSIDGAWPESLDWLQGVDLSPGAGSLLLPASSATVRPVATAPFSPPPAGSSLVTPAPSATIGSGNGSRRALCIGIDAYKPPNALQGCVNDTEAWGTVLGTLGFKVDKLVDQRATRQAMLDALSGMMRSAQPGDVLVFQYSGHGTQVPDQDGDERDGTDEAFVPYDFEDGAFLIDDDIRGVFAQLPDGVNLTCFIDCCHSGTITRMLGRNADDSTAAGQTRSRYLKETGDWDDWMRAHERFRQRERAIRDLGTETRGAIDADAIRWVNFSACDATEVAYETRGSGDFTKLATAILGSAATQASNREFQDAVIKGFGEHRRQTPQLDCADSATAARLLQPLH